MKASHLMLVACSLFAPLSQAQQTGSTFPQPVQSPPLVQDHASTVQEGFLRGSADGVRAVGEYNYNTATAALIFEEARKAAYGNEMRHAETFWNKKNYYDTQISNRKQRRSPVPTEGTLKPQAAPVALRTPVPFADPGQPGFVWPAAFNHPAFAASRERLAFLFAERSPTNSGAQSASYVQIQNVTGEMRSTLTDLVRTLPPMASVEARHFLDRAAYEASLPVAIKVAAVN